MVTNGVPMYPDPIAVTEMLDTPVPLGVRSGLLMVMAVPLSLMIAPPEWITTSLMLLEVKKLAPVLVLVAFKVPPLKFTTLSGVALKAVTSLTVAVPLFNRLRNDWVPAALENPVRSTPFPLHHPGATVLVPWPVKVAAPAPPPTFRIETAPEVVAEFMKV